MFKGVGLKGVVLPVNGWGLIRPLFHTISKINMIYFILFHPKSPNFYFQSVNVLLADSFIMHVGVHMNMCNMRLLRMLNVRLLHGKRVNRKNHV